MTRVLLAAGAVALLLLAATPARAADPLDDPTVLWIRASQSRFAVQVNGEAWDFAQAKYQNRSSDVRLKDGDGTRINVEWREVTFGHFLNTLGFVLTDACLRADDGQEYCRRAGEATLRTYLNGEEVPPAVLAAHVLKEGDSIAVAYHGPVYHHDPRQVPAFVEGAAAALVGVALLAWVVLARNRAADEDAWRPTRGHALGGVVLVLVGGAALATAVTTFQPDVDPAPRLVLQDGGAAHVTFQTQDGATQGAGLVRVGNATLDAPPGWLGDAAGLPPGVGARLVGLAEGDEASLTQGGTSYVIRVETILAPHTPSKAAELPASPAQDTGENP